MKDSRERKVYLEGLLPKLEIQTTPEGANVSMVPRGACERFNLGAAGLCFHEGLIVRALRVGEFTNREQRGKKTKKNREP